MKLVMKPEEVERTATIPAKHKGEEYLDVERAELEQIRPCNDKLKIPREI